MIHHIRKERIHVRMFVRMNIKVFLEMRHISRKITLNLKRKSGKWQKHGMKRCSADEVCSEIEVNENSLTTSPEEVRDKGQHGGLHRV